MPDPLEAHYKVVIKAITDGRMVPFFGAGVNQFGRPSHIEWKANESRYLPNGLELAEYLADTFGYQSERLIIYCPQCSADFEPRQTCQVCNGVGRLRKQDLSRISQYVELMSGPADLYDELHKVFNADFGTTELHKFFAELPGIMRAKDYETPLLVVTTNYDDLMERAFQEVNEPFDVITYIAHGEHRGMFWHRGPNVEGSVLIEMPNVYGPDLLTEYPVILKIHGAVSRDVNDSFRDSYVITEDHYIDYLTRADITNLLPIRLAAKLRNTHFLFLGYALRDWNLRVFLNRISVQRELNYRSWAIQSSPEDLETRFWFSRHIDIYDARLEDYIPALRSRVQEHPRRDQWR